MSSSSFARRLVRNAGDGTGHVRFAPWFFGITQLDQVIGGVRPGFTNLLVARPHVGKTLLVLAGIRNNPDVPTLFVSADDDPEVIVRKMMQFDGVVTDGWDASPDDMAEYVSTVYPNLDVVEDVTWGPSAYNGTVSLAEAVDRFTDAHDTPPGLIAYDYLGIDGQDFSTAIATASWMKKAAKELPMPILTIAQSSRQSTKMVIDGDRKVRRGFEMSDISFGGEQQAGLMMGLTRAFAYVGGVSQPVIEVDVVKNKAIFDGSGITNREHPIVLCHSHGRLIDRQQADREYMTAVEVANDEQRRANIDW